MVWVLGAAVAVLLAVVIVLSVKLCRLRRSCKEISVALKEHLSSDTNTLIDVSVRDKYVCRLVSDINDQLKILRRQRQQYLTGDRELKEAVTNISHDLRTPLAAICGYLELMEQENTSTEVARYIEIIKGRTEIMKQLTEELFRYSVILSSKSTAIPEEVVVNRVLEESIGAFYTALSERGITPEIKITEQRIIRRLDPAALSRVFSNLLNNVIKYSDGDLEITLADSGEITFTNTAPGLTEVQIGKLFDRFYTVEAARKSTGLGLSIAKTLIEQLNGTITAGYKNSRLIITITLPEDYNK